MLKPRLINLGRRGFSILMSPKGSERIVTHLCNGNSAFDGYNFCFVNPPRPNLRNLRLIGDYERGFLISLSAVFYEDIETTLAIPFRGTGIC